MGCSLRSAGQTRRRGAARSQRALPTADRAPVRHFSAATRRPPAPGAVQSLEYAGLRDVYVTELLLTNTVEMFKNEGYKPNGSITSGINSPDGAFLDRDGNLYVANLGFTGPPGITEYAPRGSSPKFIYGANKIDPVTVSVDRYGHVYDADYIGFVAEYGQGRNKILKVVLAGSAVIY